MKIIVFGDIHMATGNIRQIPAISEADLIVLNGDLTNYGTVQDVKEVLDSIMSYNENVLAQFGNLDQPEINDYLDDLGINLHGQAKLVKRRVCLIGIGGSNYTPFGTPSEFDESELEHLGQSAFDQAKGYTQLAENLHSKKIPQILISHAPPYETVVDKIRSGKHVGSKAVRSLIERYQPDLCVCGHIHEAKGEDIIDKTPVLNHGMFKRGGWVSVTVEQSQLNISLQ